MSGIFKGSEIVGIGIQIEKNGLEFYRFLADSSQNEKVKECCKFLAGEEKRQIEDVIDTLIKKLKRRHPHVFAGKKVRTVKDIITNWKKIKEMETQN